MNYKKTLILSLFILCVSIGFASFVLADDVLKAAPGCCKVLLENENVRVIDYSAKAGEKAGMHSHPAHVAYALVDGKTKFTNADGSTREAELKAGQAIYSPAVTHATENIGSSDLHVIIVEIKK